VYGLLRPRSSDHQTSSASKLAKIGTWNREQRMETYLEVT
jgi:hypothetical protein